MGLNKYGKYVENFNGLHIRMINVFLNCYTGEEVRKEKEKILATLNEVVEVRSKEIKEAVAKEVDV